MPVTVADPGERLVPPPAPATLAESGVGLDMLVQLTLKMLLFSGELTGHALAERLGLPFSVIEPAVESIRAQRQCEVSSGSMIGPPSFGYRITDAGRTRAALFLEQNHYVGAAPVPLEQYCRYMEGVRSRRVLLATPQTIRRALSHLVLSDRVLDQLGPAINAGHSLFVYGPPGNGKTVIARAINNLFEDELAVPHAICVDGSIIRFFDPVNHQESGAARPEASLDSGIAEDRRWVRCRRPLVVVGGELSLDQLELQYSESLGTYRAPIQAVANGGVLVIDDFGRQSCSASALLNRWVVPLESRVDFLTLRTGQKIEFPFVAMVVFATNIRPSELVDEALTRRIQYKVCAENPTDAEFTQIFENCCRERGLAYRPALPEHLLTSWYRPRHVELRGCHPRDIIDHALVLAEYLGQSRDLTPALIDAACASYFIDERQTAAAGV